jgi:hypothetical protein
VGWYDVNRPQELSTRMGESLVYIEKGLHSSNGNIFSNAGQVRGCTAGFVCSRGLADAYVTAHGSGPVTTTRGH